MSLPVILDQSVILEVNSVWKYNAPHRWIYRKPLFDIQLKFKMSLNLSHFYSVVLSVLNFLAYLLRLFFTFYLAVLF